MSMNEWMKKKSKLVILKDGLFYCPYCRKVFFEPGETYCPVCNEEED